MEFPAQREHQKEDRIRRSQAGFSLLELLVVIGILALLATLVGPRLIGYFSKAKSQTAQIQISNIGSAVELYFLDIGRYPPQEPGLAALVSQPSGVSKWSGPYLKKKDGLTDPWGRPYLYRFPGENGEFDIYTLGRDGQQGGEGEDGDVTNW
ncbi:MAG: type II secretion system major pseudopilin GspG [Pseudomonadota bacterium]